MNFIYIMSVTDEYSLAISRNELICIIDKNRDILYSTSLAMFYLDKNLVLNALIMVVEKKLAKAMFTVFCSKFIVQQKYVLLWQH